MQQQLQDFQLSLLVRLASEVQFATTPLSAMCPSVTSSEGRSSAVHPHGRVYREAYASWQRAWGQYGKLAPRALAAWRTAETWTQRHLPAIYGSLRSEASGLHSDIIPTGTRVGAPSSGARHR